MRLYGEVHLSLIWIHQPQRIKMLTYFDKIGSIAIKKNDKLSHKNHPVYLDGMTLSQALSECLL